MNTVIDIKVISAYLAVTALRNSLSCFDSFWFIDQAIMIQCENDDLIKTRDGNDTAASVVDAKFNAAPIYMTIWLSETGKSG